MLINLRKCMLYTHICMLYNNSNEYRAYMHYTISSGEVNTKLLKEVIHGQENSICERSLWCLHFTLKFSDRSLLKT